MRWQTTNWGDYSSRISRERPDSNPIPFHSSGSSIQRPRVWLPLYMHIRAEHLLLFIASDSFLDYFMLMNGAAAALWYNCWFLCAQKCLSALFYSGRLDCFTLIQSIVYTNEGDGEQVKNRSHLRLEYNLKCMQQKKGVLDKKSASCLLFIAGLSVHTESQYLSLVVVVVVIKKRWLLITPLNVSRVLFSAIRAHFVRAVLWF